MEPSIFLDFNLPNAATWLYFSLILTVALFFQFGRVLSVRNLDLLTLFLLAPGLLFLQEAHTLLAAGDPHAEADTPALRIYARGHQELVVGYTWLLVGSAYWFGRAIVDLALVRRPALTPNLNTAGLGWLAVALFFCLTAVAVRRTGDPVPGPVGARPIPIEQFQDGATAVVQQTQSADGQGASPADVRFWVERSLAMACHLAVALGLVFIGLRHFQDVTAGAALAALYLLLPYTAYHIGQFHLVLPAAFVTWAVFCYRRPVVSGWLLGLGAGSAFFPLLLFPLWMSFYARRGATRFALSFASALVVSLGVLTLVLWWDGQLNSSFLAALADWLPWKRPATESLWTGVHGAYRLPLFVLYVGFLAVVTVWPSPKNLSHLVALSAAVLIGVQFWHADRGGVYVLWYLPLVLLMVFRPNLTAHEPPTLTPGSGVLGWAWRRVRSGRASTAPKDLAI